MKYKTLILLLCLSALCKAQTNQSLRKVVIYEDVQVHSDSLSIAPQTVVLQSAKGNIIDEGLYLVDAVNGKIIFKDIPSEDYPLQLRYRVIAISLNTPYYHKDTSIINYDNKRDAAILYEYTSNVQQGFVSDGLDKNGSISRGISFGNSSDMSLSSSLNLQVSGKLDNNLNITAAISDNSVPIQPEGYSQQLQEFDNIFIQLYNEKYSLTAGNFQLFSPQGYHLKMNKKLQGGLFQSDFTTKGGATVTTATAGAISRGKFARNSFNGIEGNQGPYRLKGENNESYIVVLSGTEKVFIDGRLLKRGIENDYVINYNTAELTFTTNQLITKDKRIVVEFEYSDKDYARFIGYNSIDIQKDKNRFWLNVYHEEDNKNQPLQQELSDTEKFLLAGIGDNISTAFSPGIYPDSVWDETKILYIMRDTSTFGGAYYDSVFVFSPNQQNDTYRLRFSFVGENKGNYVIEQSVANGRIYAWVEPIAGVPQGAYEPVILLSTPKKKQLISFGGMGEYETNTKVFYEMAISNNDVNTFSNLDKNDNTGYSVKLGVEQNFLFKDSLFSGIKTNVDYEFTHRNFKPVERYRGVEFERDWNINLLDIADQHLLNVMAELYSKKELNTSYAFNFMERGGDYRGIKNDISIYTKIKGLELDGTGSILYALDPLNESTFTRYKGLAAYELLFVRFGIEDEYENNIWYALGNDSLQSNSYSFHETRYFIENNESIDNRYFINYTQRKDFLPGTEELQLGSLGKDVLLGTEISSFSTSHVKLQTGYRILEIQPGYTSSNSKEESLISRMEYSGRYFKNAITTNTFYEVGSGLEARKEFSYLEVPAGQGVYSHTDYNGNGLQELDEFEVAAFPDQARYIRILIPSTQYEKVFSNQFTQVFNVRPYVLWRKETGVRKMLSHFSEKLALNSERKNTGDDIVKNILPWNTGLQDSSIRTINTSIRNTFSFNRASDKFSADYIFQQSTNRILLVYGLDTRSFVSHGLQSRFRIVDGLQVFNQVMYNQKSYQSEFLSSKNYLLDIVNENIKLEYESGTSHKISLWYDYLDKENRQSTDISIAHEGGLAWSYNMLKKGVLNMEINYVDLKFTGDNNTSLAYEMLEGLYPGRNVLWTLGLTRSLTDLLEMSVVYSGRKSEETKAIHMGSMQLQVVF